MTPYHMVVLALLVLWQPCLVGSGFLKPFFRRLAVVLLFQRWPRCS